MTCNCSGKNKLICNCEAWKTCHYKNYKRKEQEYEELKKCYKNNSSLLDFEETNTTKLVNKVMKLEQTLAEIKEIAKKEVNTRMLFADKESFCDFNKILQKISECEVNNAR